MAMMYVSLHVEMRVDLDLTDDEIDNLTEDTLKEKIKDGVNVKGLQDFEVKRYDWE
jgi:hypothetical protein